MLYKLCYIVNINTDPTPEGVIRLKKKSQSKFTISYNNY